MCSGSFVEALEYYQLALKAETGDKEDAAKLYSNLSATSAKLGKYVEAMEEAAEAIRLQPAWHKGYLRRSHAMICLQQYTEASEVIEQGIHRAKDTASLFEAKEALKDLSSTLKHSKKPKHYPTQQPATSIQAVVGKLQAAGAATRVLPRHIRTQCCSAEYALRDLTLDNTQGMLTLQALTQHCQLQS